MSVPSLFSSSVHIPHCLHCCSDYIISELFAILCTVMYLYLYIHKYGYVLLFFTNLRSLKQRENILHVQQYIKSQFCFSASVPLWGQVHTFFKWLLEMQKILLSFQISTLHPHHKCVSTFSHICCHISNYCTHFTHEN